MDTSIITASWQNLLIYSILVVSVGWAIGSKITFHRSLKMTRAG